MELVTDGVAIVEGDDHVSYRAHWVVKQLGSRVWMEMNYHGRTRQEDVDEAVIKGGSYDEFAKVLLIAMLG